MSYSNEMIEKVVAQLLIDGKWNETRLRKAFPSVGGSYYKQYRGKCVR